MGVRKRSAKKRVAHPGVRLASLSTQTEEDDEDDHEARQIESSGLGMDLESSFTYTEIPDEVLVGADVDLSIWSVVAQDTGMLRLGGHQLPVPTKRRKRNSSAKARAMGNQLADILAIATNAQQDAAQNKHPPVQRLNLAGAEQITDQALATITALCPQLTSLNVEKASKLTDAGVRHLVSSCRHLHALHLSYLPLLRGVALVAIAESHLPLRELALAGCTHVPEFALHRFFLACPTLESLDLSLCASANDATLLALGKACPRLRHLRLRGCREFSDAGVVHIASYCHDLTTLDLTRLDLAYKLTDVALLALGEHCLLLQSLTLRGCEMLTDVGVTWLASGCPALTHLDLNDCRKITDVALRAIGEHLLQLRHLTLRHCVRVSDRGVRHLALGCPDLAWLDVSGLLLLTDSSNHAFADHSDGMGFVARQCPRLRHADLSRCVSIGDGVLQQLSKNNATHLSTLHLDGCSHVTSHGVRSVLRQCSQLSVLTLGDCVAVTDAAFHHVERISTQLTTLRLRNCVEISDTTLSQLARARLPLRELDIGGCTRVTDLGILSLSESPNATLMRSLWLRDNPQISETALSWLAERCKKLKLLDLTRCPRIRAFSLKALVSEWKFATLAVSQEFKGLQPVYRADDRLFLEEYGACWRAAIRIQCLYRARVARRVARQKQEEKLVLWVATRLQSVFRGRQARKLAVLRRLEFRHETAAAIRIQTRYRHRRARALAAKRRVKREAEMREEAARRLQLAWRRKRLRDKLLLRSERREREKQRRQHAAITLQRRWRGKKTRDRVNVLRAAKEIRDQDEKEAANKMQSLFRGRAARREAQRKRDEQREQACREEQAALLVQKHVRRRRAQLELRRRRAQDKRLHDAARLIQRRWRRKKRDVAMQIVAIGRQRKREYDAAVKLQAAWKRKKGRDAIRLLRLMRETQRQEEIQAALRLQTHWRGKRARQQASSIKQQALEKVLQQLRLETRSATLIQAHFRGRRGRIQYRALVLHKKQTRWKAIVDPTTQQTVYYNKETGEVRYRRPQDVLDLLPRPPCDNCDPSSVEIARVECRDCGEMYCDPCWRRVHAGGRRKAHVFRALYDFYDKRVDYGDGEFPSCWPSEMLQDDLDGWMLRVFPHRPPTDTRGSWERYEDASTQRVWYYNKETEAFSYDTAPPWSTTETPSGWQQYVDETTGHTYYYNARTQESTYARPAAFFTPRVGESPVESSDHGWAKYYDSTYGVYYYYHAVSQTSTFERPAAFGTPRVDATSATTRGLQAYVDGQQTYYYDAQTTECRVATQSTRSLQQLASREYR